MRHRPNLTPALAAYAIGLAPAPVGFRRDGRPIFPIAGAEDDPPADPPADPPKSTEPPTAYTPPATQADLDRIIGERVARERAKFSDYSEIKAKAAEHDKALEAARSDQEKAVEAAKAEGRTEALSSANTRLVSAEARALAAATRFANPALVVRAIDLSDITVNDDGSVDADAIKAKLDAAKNSGAFVIDDGKPSRPKPDRSQGNPPGNTASSVSRGRDRFNDKHSPKTNA